MAKDLDYYRALPYQRRVERIEEEDGSRYFVARIVELGGCFAAGDSRSEAIANLKEAFDDYVDAWLEWGRDLPEPGKGMPKARGGVFKYEGASAASSSMASTEQPEEKGLTAA